MGDDWARPVVHWEIEAVDADAQRAFYAAMFNWEIGDGPIMQIPAGKITSYATLAKVLNTSPRAIGGALRNNPFAPEVPCHRVIAADGYVGGFKGDWEKAPSGINQTMKLELLKGEAVEFDGQGRLLT